MKKRFAVVGLSLALGITLLASTAFASATNISGYDAYKAAAENTFANKNLTMKVAANIADNGNSLFTVNSVLKASKDGTNNFSGNTTINADGKTITVTNYGKDGQMVTKVDGNDTYYINKMDGEFKNEKAQMMDQNMAEREKVGNLVMDSLIGDLKNNFVSKANSDGTSTISMNLEGSQIPAVVNGVVSLAVKDGAMHEGNTHMNKAEMDAELNSMFPGAKDINVELPKLVQDISVKSASLTAEVSTEKIITAQTMTFVVTGKDEAGKVHEITFIANVDLSDMNKTTPDSVDLTGKTTKVIEQKDMRTEK